MVDADLSESMLLTVPEVASVLRTSPKAIYAIQVIHYPPDDLPSSAHKLYRVRQVVEDDGVTASVKPI